MINNFFKIICFFCLVVSTLGSTSSAEEELTDDLMVPKPIVGGRYRSISLEETSKPSDMRSSPSRKTSLPTDDNRPVILIVEDQKQAQSLFKLFFNAYRKDYGGYKLIFAPTGQEGIELCLQHQPFLVFVDYNLEGTITGAEVITTIKERKEEIFGGNRPDSSVTHTFVGFSSDKTSNEEMKKVGATYAIPKLLNKKLFHEVLDKVLPIITE